MMTIDLWWLLEGPIFYFHDFCGKAVFSTAYVVFFLFFFWPWIKPTLEFFTSSVSGIWSEVCLKLTTQTCFEIVLYKTDEKENNPWKTSSLQVWPSFFFWRGGGGASFIWIKNPMNFLLGGSIDRSLGASLTWKVLVEIGSLCQTAMTQICARYQPSDSVIFFSMDWGELLLNFF